MFTFPALLALLTAHLFLSLTLPIHFVPRGTLPKGKAGLQGSAYVVMGLFLNSLVSELVYDGSEVLVFLGDNVKVIVESAYFLVFRLVFALETEGVVIEKLQLGLEMFVKIHFIHFILLFDQRVTDKQIIFSTFDWLPIT